MGNIGNTLRSADMGMKRRMRFASVLLANLGALDQEVVDHFVKHLHQIPDALKRGFTLPVSAPLPGFDGNFSLVEDLGIITVPANYSHLACFFEFAKKHGEEFYSYNPNINDQNLVRVSTRLSIGERFRVRIFQVQEPALTEDCLAFLRYEKAVLVGAQGLALAYDQAKEKFPINRWTASFDEKETLFVDPVGNCGVPGIRHRPNGDRRFSLSLGYGEGFWDSEVCVLCFTAAE